MSSPIPATLVAVLALGCAATSPESVARKYLNALAAADGEIAWHLLSDKARKKMSRAEHNSRVNSLTSAQKAKYSQAGIDISRKALAVHWSGGKFPLIMAHRGGNSWVVTSVLPTFDKLHTPLESLRTFARLVRMQDYDTMMSLVPTHERYGLSTEVLRDRFSNSQLQAQVIKALDALLQSGDGRKLEENTWRFERGKHRADLIKEGEHWRLLDLR